jgi:hypothetical protein
MGFHGFFFFSSKSPHSGNPSAPSSFSGWEKSHRGPLKVVLVEHTQPSQGFTSGFSVRVGEAKASGGDEPRVHIRIAGASLHKNHRVAPKGATGDVFSVGVLRRFHNPNAFQAEQQ